MLTTNIIQRVLFVKYGNSVGTAFTLEKESKQYLFSAKHVFPNLNNPDKIEVFNDGAWKEVRVKPLFCKDNSKDVIAFDIGDTTITPKHEIEIGMGGIVFGQDAYFLGFPYGLSTDSGEINNKYPFPFVKKCIVSSINKSLIFLDGHNNKGFSGGPVVVCLPGNKIKVIGIVSGFLNDIVNKSENSGIFYANSVSLIFDEIESARDASK